MSAHRFALDENQFVFLSLAEDESRVTLTLSSPEGRTAEGISLLARLHVGHHVHAFENRAVTLPRGEEPLLLVINNHPFLTLTRVDGAWRCEVERRLTVFETRTLGRAPQHELPSTSPEEPPLTPLTDLHTHLSGQVRGTALVAIGVAHGVSYPTAILDELGIAYPCEGLVEIPRRLFLPTAHLQKETSPTEAAISLAHLSENAQIALAHALSLTPERPSTFQELESCYFRREPLTKDLRLLPDILRAIAHAYAKEGVRYAELSTNAVVEPGWLKVIHESLPSIEAQTGVALRFLAGVPRNLDEDSIDRRLARVAELAASPYLRGIDFLGFESNKTSHMGLHIESFAEWMRLHRPDWVMRIHAGENAKNQGNVLESLQFAEKLGIRLRIGHALYGIEDKVTLPLARRLGETGQLIMEFNPDSNLAGNNLDFAHQLTLKSFLDAGVPCVLGTDGAGLYHTDAGQTAFSAWLSGCRQEQFAAMRAVEERYIAEQAAVFAERHRALPADFLANLPTTPLPRPRARHQAISTPAQLPSDNRRPLLVIGANGTAWDMLSDERKRSVSAMFRALIFAGGLRPESVYFVIGRAKDTGIGEELARIIAEYNRSHSPTLECYLLMAEDKPGAYLPEGITQKIALEVPLLYLPDAIVPEIALRGGMVLAAGGRSFTRDMVELCERLAVPLALRDDVPGASQEKSEVYPMDAVDGMATLLARLSAWHPAAFPSPDAAAAQAEYLRAMNLIGA